MDASDLRIALVTGNYNYVRDGANQALNRLVEYLLRQGAQVRAYDPAVRWTVDGDYVEFEMLLGSGLRKHQLECFGWSFMPNHWHGVVRCPPEGLSRFMKAEAE